MKFSFILLIATQISFSSCDTRCNKQTCNAMRRSCPEKRFSSEPNGFCLSKFSPKELSEFDFKSTKYCEASCNTEEGGTFAQCLLDNEPLCIQDRGALTLAQTCKYPLVDASDQACLERCSHARFDCDLNCPATSVQACLDCSSNCGLEVIHCRRKCK
jgi:hypothetical protein